MIDNLNILAYNFKFKWRSNPTKTSSYSNSKNSYPQTPPQLSGPATWIFSLSPPMIISSSSTASASKRRKSSSHNKPNQSRPWPSARIVSCYLLSTTFSLWTNRWLDQTRQNIEWLTDFVSGQRALQWGRVPVIFEILRAIVYRLHAIPEKLTRI